MLSQASEVACAKFGMEPSFYSEKVIGKSNLTLLQVAH